MFFTATCGFITRSTCHADMRLSPVATRGFSDFETGTDFHFFAAHFMLFFGGWGWGGIGGGGEGEGSE